MGDYLPNSTQVLDVYLDEYMALLTGAEWKVLCYIIRRTFGFRKGSDWISLDQFVHGITKKGGEKLDNGTGLTRASVIKALKELVGFGLVRQDGKAGTTPTYGLQLDGNKIFRAQLNGRKHLADMENKKRVAKARKQNPLIKGTRSVGQNDTRSVGQNTQESVNQESADNSSELGVPNSTELAENVSTHLSAAPVLNPAEREILRACNDGVVIAHYHNAEAANHLIALGMIERCQCGAKEVLCLKGQCPTHDKPCPDDMKVTEMQTILASIANPTNEVAIDPDRPTHDAAKQPTWRSAVQSAFLPGSNGNQPETVVTPSPQTPLPSPAPAALPEVPEGYEAMYGFGGTNSEFRHYRPIGKKRTLCAAHHPYSKPVNNLNFVHQCPDCAAKAAARPATAKKAKPKKPAIYSDQHLFDLIAAFMNITGEAEIRANAPQIGKARKALCDYILDKIKREPTADELPKIYERLEAVGPWYDKACKGCDRPGWDKVTKWYIKYVQSLNGTAQAEGDAEWFDAPNGRWLKREKGVLYERDHDNQEQWNRVER